MIIFRLLPKVHIQLEPDSNKKKKNLDVWTTGSKISKQGSATCQTSITSPNPQWVFFPSQPLTQTCRHNTLFRARKHIRDMYMYAVMQTHRHAHVHQEMQTCGYRDRPAKMQICRHAVIHTQTCRHSDVQTGAQVVRQTCQHADTQLG